MQIFKGINVVSISVTDLDVAREFYGRTLGLGTPLYDLPEAGWIEFQTGAAHGNIAVTLAEVDWMPNCCHAACAVTSQWSSPATLPFAASMIPLVTACSCAALPPPHKNAVNRLYTR